MKFYTCIVLLACVVFAVAFPAAPEPVPAEALPLPDAEVLEPQESRWGRGHYHGHHGFHGHHGHHGFHGHHGHYGHGHHGGWGGHYGRGYHGGWGGGYGYGWGR